MLSASCRGTKIAMDYVCIRVAVLPLIYAIALFVVGSRENTTTELRVKIYASIQPCIVFSADYYTNKTFQTKFWNNNYL